MLSKSDYDKLDERLNNITSQPVEQLEINSDLPPTIEQLEDNNKTYSIMAAILFIDIRKSTYLTENSQTKSMVKIYRSFMRMAVECVRKNGGVTRQFLGDRIMGVFIDSIDENGSVTDKAVDKAINAARSLQTTIDFSLNKHLENNVNGKIIDCGIGIDYGKVLVTQVGMYGVENNENKENEVDCVWVGKTTNYASKYSDIADGGEIFISENVYNGLSYEYKDVWTQSAKYKGTKLFLGYVTKGYYLDFFDQLGNPIKIEDNSAISMDTSSQLADGIKEIENLQNKLIQREKELAVIECRLKKENQDLKTRYNNEYSAKLKAVGERDSALKHLEALTEDYYNFICKIISFAHCKVGYTQYVTEDFWITIIKKCYEIGRKLGYSDKAITSKIDCGLIAIYSYYKKYDKAYEAILIMAELNTVWVNLEDKTIQWAKENYKLHLLQIEIEKRLLNNTIAPDHRNGFELNLYKVKQLRGV